MNGESLGIKIKNIGLTIPGNCWSFVADFMKYGGFHT